MTRNKGTRKIRRLKRHHGKLYAVLTCGHVVEAGNQDYKVGDYSPCRICDGKKK